MACRPVSHRPEPDVPCGSPRLFASLHHRAPQAQPTITYRLEDSTEGREGVLFTSNRGYIPGLEGRLNPINNDGSLYVYADNIAINGKVLHPAPFQISEALHLLDAYGVETTIRFLMVTRQFSLIEYTKPKTYEEQ